MGHLVRHPVVGVFESRYEIVVAVVDCQECREVFPEVFFGYLSVDFFGDSLVLSVMNVFDDGAARFDDASQFPQRAVAVVRGAFARDLAGEIAVFVIGAGSGLSPDPILLSPDPNHLVTFSQNPISFCSNTVYS